MPKYGDKELQYVTEFLRNTKRPWTKLLEDAFSERIGASYAISCNSGTSALHTALAVLGVGEGDEVISPAITVMMDTFVTLFQGAKPVYADVDPDTFNIDPEDVKRKITPKTKAIIPVALYGLSADLDPIIDIAAQHGIGVVEDVAQSVLSEYKGEIAGTIGDFGCFSFERTKHLATGEGGMIVTNDEDFAVKARKFAGLGYKNLVAKEGRMQSTPRTFQDPDYRRHDSLGYNYRMPEVCAAIGLAQVERMDEIIAMRQKEATIFAEAVAGCNWITPQKTPQGLVNSYYTFAVKYDGQEALGLSWKAFYGLYVSNGGDGFYAAWGLPYKEPYGQKLWLTGDCPVAEKLQPKIMQFKTNYRDIELAKNKARILKNLINDLGARK
jgi:perosamine synthetase